MEATGIPLVTSFRVVVLIQNSQLCLVLYKIDYEGKGSIHLHVEDI